MTTRQPLLAMCACALATHPVSATVDARVLRRRLSAADRDVIIDTGSRIVVADGAV